MYLRLIITSLVMGSYVDVATCILIPYARPFSSMPTCIETWWHLQVKEMTVWQKATAREKRRRDQTQFLAECVRRIPSVYWEPTNWGHYQDDTAISYYMLKGALWKFSFVTISDRSLKDLFQSSWNMEPPFHESFKTWCCVITVLVSFSKMLSPKHSCSTCSAYISKTWNFLLQKSWKGIFFFPSS